MSEGGPRDPPHCAGPAGRSMCSFMSELHPFLLFIAAVFLLAGFVKGVVGLGLPTVSMDLLAVTMAPSQALAIVIVPAVVTNIWQTFVGPDLRDITRRLWPLLIGTAARYLAEPGFADRALRALSPHRARHPAGDLCGDGSQPIRFHGRTRQREMGRRHCRSRHRPDFGRDRRAGHSVDAVPAGDRHGAGTNWCRRSASSSRLRRWHSPSISPLWACCRPRPRCRAPLRWAVPSPACILGKHYARGCRRKPSAAGF